jgi:putative ABC transport system permease protein
VFRRRKQRERDLERELRAHLDMETEELGDAYAARRALGNATLIKEEVRGMWGWRRFEELARNLRQAVRALAKRPSLAVVAIVSLSAGIGANTAVFSLARGIVLKKLPVPGADRLVIPQQHNTAFHIDNCCFSPGFFKELRRTDVDFEDMLAVGAQEIVLADASQAEKIYAEIVSPNYFRMLGVQPALGRLLDEADEMSGRTCTVSYDLWQERFGGRSDVIGRQVTLNAEPFVIVGVTGPGFHGAALHDRADLQMPSWMADKLIGQGSGWAQLLGRLKPGVRRQQAEARLNALGKQIQQSIGPRMGPHDDFFLRDGSQGIDSQKERYGKPVLLLLLLVAVVLLAACCNLAALMLVRSVERRKEAGMRLALGASRGMLIRQFLTESLMLAAAGGACGWAVGRGLNRVLLSLLDSKSAGLARQADLDWTVFAFCAGVSALAGILFGALPAWRGANTDPLSAIQGTGSAGRRSVLSSALIAAQIALSLALLFGAGLFAQTLRHLRAIDVGFPAEDLTLLRIDHSALPKGSAAFFEELLRRARELPETRAASLASISMLSGSMGAYTIRVPDSAPSQGAGSTAYSALVSDGYLRTLGLPLLEGRDLTASDRPADETPVIVNQEFARQFLGGAALGKTFLYGGRRTARVIGVAGTGKYRNLREEPQPVMYAPFFPEFFPTALVLQVRSSSNPEVAISQIRALVKAIDAGAVIDSASTMEMQIDQGLARERMLAFLSTFLGGLSVVLAGIGLYGVLAFSVSRRSKEIGIRMAIGADRRGILAMVLGEGAWIVVAGIAAGIPLALACGRLATTLLYGLKPQDAATAIAATALLALAALVASLVPAWRATRVDPMTALRND